SLVPGARPKSGPGCADDSQRPGGPSRGPVRDDGAFRREIMGAKVQTPLQLYLKQINESPLLTADEEKMLARRIIHQQDMSARERMVRSNLRLVVNIAKHYSNRGLSLMDLIEEGNIGLLKAVRSEERRVGTESATGR